VGVDEFTDGNGWRYPFLLSIVLVGVSIFIRLRMQESPLFAKLKHEGKTSKNPLKESFGNKANFKMVLLALFGVTMGQGVIWYTGQFYAQTFILSKCHVEYEQANTIILIALAIATPFFVLFGALSDKWGRKNIMMAGILLGVLLYRPIFNEIYETADVSYKDIAETSSATAPGALAAGGITTVFKVFKDNSRLKTTAIGGIGKQAVRNEVTLNDSDKWKIIMLVAVMVLFVTMVYGPVAAFLVELFPTRIRYTSMSLPYHIGNGVFGGLVPFIATLITTIRGTDHLSGLWYPIGVGALSFIIGSLYLANKVDENVAD
jgi:MHS family proline/betaine transporter-like MFS transporter